mmetsp:Transcript_25925/g.46996  ORF Transcript_25925/g.46996 Transcript_25925/m.46996 type:complete len:444 (+) Transcript_25925:126-1457(+)
MDLANCSKAERPARMDGERVCSGVISDQQQHLVPTRLPIRTALLFLIASTVGTTFGFQVPPQWRKPSVNPAPKSPSIHNHNSPFLVYHNRNSIHADADRRKTPTKMNMVRNIDLPEALVFYGVESMMTQERDKTIGLRSGVSRLLNECRELGTAALFLSEEFGEEESVKQFFLKALAESSNVGGVKTIEKTLHCDDPIINFRCLNSEFVTPESNNNDDTPYLSDEHDEDIEFYNVHINGRSPSPAFLLDSLCSVHIDPQGFGGSSGFGTGQWIDPRRSPMPARTVVFIAGDWDTSEDSSMDMEALSTVYDRCAAARAAGCRIIYIEQLPDETQQNIPVRDDTQTMALCDAVITTLGNDNPRDLQPISLDAVSTPGDYWLNPPTPRDDVGNRVSVDDIVEWFRSEREMEEIVGDEGCVVNDDGIEGEDMSEEEMNKILADLDGL